MLNDGANKGAWRRQLRDRYGRWVRMYGAVTFEASMPGVKGKVIGHGKFVGRNRVGYALIEVEDDKYIPKGTYEVEDKYITAVKAVLKLDQESKPETSKVTKALKSEISGDEVLYIIKGDAGLMAKENHGRFPLPRKNQDIFDSAKKQYSKVYDALKKENPELLKDFPDYESFWEYAHKNMAVRTDTPYPDDNSDKSIPPLMKAVNRIYARDILGLDPDGFITYYRNAVNHKTEEWHTASGYASLDRDMAYDYNSHVEQSGADGRYEIKVKPDELRGLIGFSEASDEYGVTIGPGTTKQPDRVKRVGDLETVQIAPWVSTKEFNRSGGDSPFRFFRTAGQFKFYQLDSNPLPGNGYQDFYDSLGLEKGAIPSKFDELFGEGAFEQIKALGFGVPAYSFLQSLFVEQNGKWGFNPLALDKLLVDTGSIANGDPYDGTLKFISVIQELLGKPFMVNKGHNPKDPRLANIQ